MFRAVAIGIICTTRVNFLHDLQAARFVAGFRPLAELPLLLISHCQLYRLQSLLSRLLTHPPPYVGPSYPQRSPVGEGGHYGRGANTRPGSYADNNGHSPTHFGHGRRFGQGQRVVSDPALYGQNNQGVYPSHGYQQSYDTVASASVNGSGATEPWGNSTDPSSENSSIDRVQPASKPDVAEQYGLNGFGGAPQFQGPILEEHGQNSPAYGQPGYGQSHMAPGGGFPFQGNDVAPPPPAHGGRGQTAPRVPIKLGGSAPPVSSSPPAPSSEKRRSWLKRRFSKG